MRIHRTETGEPVPGAPTYNLRTRLHFPHYTRTFTHCMGLFGHMRIHVSGTDHNSDTPTTSNKSTMPNTTVVPSPAAIIITTTTTTTTTASSLADTDTVDLSCRHCPRTFTSGIGLVGHLRIHRTETNEPVPGAPTYTHQTRLNCPHCPRTFRHRMGLFGHMRIHDGLRSSETAIPSFSSFSCSSCSSSSTAATTAAQATISRITNPDTNSDTIPSNFDSSDGDQDYTCPHCDRTFSSHIGLVGHLRIHRTETGEPVPGAPTYNLRTRLHFPH
nr:unnamed protein product [Spirometra erinaceieuropaei]